jgi:ADP-ribose pyrophosphatase YjhB (NUDIX family)
VTSIDDNSSTQVSTSWLSPEDLELVRANMPIVYVDAVPVRVDGLGNVEAIGMLLRQGADRAISRMVVTGRVLYGERIREALMRHCEKDLGPMALPRVPANPTPFTIAEYFPDPDKSGFFDPRHHAVSLAYVVPVDGECEPTQEALDLRWFTPQEAVSNDVVLEMTSGHDRLIRLALAHVGKLP